jgi:putative ABC transport system substrate-binding protein
VKGKLTGFALCSLFLTFSGLVHAQQPADKIPRVIITRPEQPGASSGEVLIEAFRRGLRERGYVEGQNIVVEILWLSGSSDQIPKRFSDSTGPKADIIVTSGTASTRAAQKATNTTPIIIANLGSDPVVEGLVASFARPGGNITGLTSMSVDLVGKRLELLKETIPTLSRVAVLLDPSRPRAVEIKDSQDAAQVLGVQVQFPKLDGPEDFKAAFQSASKGRAKGLLMVAGGVFNAHRSLLVDLAGKSRLPAMYSEYEYVHAGGLMVYSSVLEEQYRRAAVFVDKILRGAKPGELPIEQPTKFELVINLKAAKQIGLTIPPNVLARADKVIR